MEALLELTVVGEPKPAGSKTAMPLYRKRGDKKVPVTRADGSVVTKTIDQNPATKPWQAAVAAAAAEAWGERDMLYAAIWLEVTCYEPRPRGHYRSGRFSHLLKPDAPAYPHRTNTGDSGKLRRAIEDALTGVVVPNDKLVVAASDRKLYGEPARAEIRLGLMSAQTVVDLGLAEAPEPAHPEGQGDLLEAA